MADTKSTSRNAWTRNARGKEEDGKTNGRRAGAKERQRKRGEAGTERERERGEVE